jgi:rod shape-determining protein MreD
VQKSLVWLLAISDYSITPDIVILAVIYIGIKRGNIEGAVSGFIAGLIYDILSGSFLGLLALAYSIAGFTAGYFHREEDEKYLYKYQFLIVVFVCSFISNFIYFNIYMQGTGANFFEVLITHVLSTSAYTTLISVAYVIIPKKGELKKVY